MKQLTTLIFALLFLVIGVSHALALPNCTGSWSTNWKNCFGTYIYGMDTEWAGDKYIGEFKDGLFHGQGTYTWASGEKYVGDFKDDNKHGQGTYTYADGDKYVGEYKSDKMHGQGTYTYGPNSEWAGDKYVGEYKSDKMHGRGTYTTANGNKYVGTFSNDNFIENYNSSYDTNLQDWVKKYGYKD